MSLTKRNLKTKAKEPGRHSVDGTKGLFLKVMSLERVFWSYRYYFQGKETELKLGDYPAVGIDEAIAIHAEKYALLKKGIDPQAERRAAEAAVKAAKSAPKKVTFGEIADDFIATHEASWKNAKHREQWKMTLSVYCAPIRGMAVDEIDASAVLSVLKPLWTRAPETASRLRGRIEQILDAARALGCIHADKANPARWRGHLDKLLPNPKKIGERGNHAALPYRDIPAFMARLREHPGVAARALEFLILTAARSNEVMGMTWGEVDLDSTVIAAGPDGKEERIAMPLWTVPAARMKMRKEHRVPLVDAAVAILEEQRRRVGAAVDPKAYVFPGRNPKTRLSVMAFEMILRRMQVGGATAHGMRSAFSDWVGEETHFQRETREAALAHLIGDKAEQAYRRGDALKKRRTLMEAWARYCARV
jgi:integrase